MLGLVRLQKDTLLDNLIRRGGGQGQAGFESGLNTGELILAGFDDLIDSFLPGADHPDLAAALAADLFHEGLQVDQQVCIPADVLADLVDHEQEPEVTRLRVHVFLNLGNELSDGSLHGLGAVKPVAGGLLTHAEYVLQSGDDVILKESVGITGLQPGRAVFLLEHAPEFLGFALLGDELLQLGNLQVLTVEAEVVVKHLGENAQHGGFVLVDGAFDIDVEKDRICPAFCCTVDQHEGGRIIGKLRPEPLHGLHALNLFVFQQVGQHFQEVRFTTSEEAGYPNADVSGGLVERLDVIVEECDEVLLQLSGDNILIQLLHEHAAFILIDLDDAVDFTVDVVFKHRLNSHVAAPSLYHVKRPVVRIRRQLIKQFHIAAIEGARIHHQNGDIRKIRLHGIQQGMDPDERKGLADTGDQDHITRLMRLVLHLSDKCHVVGHALHLVQHKLLSLFLFLLGDPISDPLIIADGEKHLVQVVFNQVTVEALISHQLLREMPDGHLVLRVIAENPDIHFVGQALALQKLRFLYQRS